MFVDSYFYVAVGQMLAISGWVSGCSGVIDLPLVQLIITSPDVVPLFHGHRGVSDAR